MKRARDDTSSQLKRPKTAEACTGSPHMASGDISDAMAYLNGLKETFDGKNGNYKEFLDIMMDFKAQRIDTTGVRVRVEELFKGQQNLIMGFNTFWPKGSETTLPEEPAAKKPVEFSEAHNFLIKVKIRLQGNDHVYKSFVDILNLHRREPKCDEEVYHEVAVLLKEHIDLIDEFRSFFPDTSRTEYARSSVLRDKDSAIPPFRRMNLDRYPIPEVTRGTELGVDVVNDNWMSVATGSKDYASKQKLKNKYEECLFRCEDDRIELDVLLYNVIATIQRIQDLLDKMNNNNNQIDIPVGIEEYITAPSLNLIERIYGDHGRVMIDMLKETPIYVLPCILKRLKQKQEEFSRCRDDFNKFWAIEYAENHRKLLDYRKKSPTTKGPLKEDANCIC